MNPKIEICLESATSVLRAEQGGADRVELCSDLFEGGLTPSVGTFRVARRLSRLPLNVMIRPRGGDFCYSDDEFAVMLEDVKVFKAEGADAIVFGILTPDGDIDMVRSAEIIKAASPLPVTFHRAFDMTRNAHDSLEQLIQLGVTRVLTSGHEATVPEGADELAALVKQAGDRIIIMPGCGISERNFEKISKQIGAKEYHVFLPSEQPSLMKFHPGHILMGGVLRQSEFTIAQTDSSRVGDIVGMARR
jgi:copper homeostasis protein